MEENNKSTKDNDESLIRYNVLKVPQLNTTTSKSIHVFPPLHAAICAFAQEESISIQTATYIVITIGLANLNNWSAKVPNLSI